MLSVAPPTPRLMNISAPAIDIGTDTRMISGSRKLSNCAASARKMMISAKPRVTDEAAGFLHDTAATRRRNRRYSRAAASCVGKLLQIIRARRPGPRRHHDARDGRGIELLEMVDRFRHGLGLDVRDGRQRAPDRRWRVRM